MSVLKRSAAIGSSFIIVGVTATIGFASLTSSKSVDAQIGSSTMIFMTTTAYNTNTNLNWGPGTTLNGPNCSTVLSHASEIQSVTGGIRQTFNLGATTGGTGAGKVTYDSMQIVKSIDSGTTPLDTYMAQGKPFNVQLYFFHPNGALPIDCSKPDMKINLVLVGGSLDGLQISGGGTETINLQFGLEAIRTSTISSGGVWSWDSNIGFCWDRVKNIACSALSVPLSA